MIIKLTRGRFFGTPAKKEKSLGRETHEGRCLSISFGWLEDEDIHGEQDPEVEIFGSTTRGYRQPRGCLLRGWNSALKGNPKGGTGMKQGRERMGGSRPREREKRCGGTETQRVEALG